eukprot:scaffold33867_cov154-Amphora_coffeaeformis.AAC.1
MQKVRQNRRNFGFRTQGGQNVYAGLYLLIKDSKGHLRLGRGYSLFVGSDLSCIYGVRTIQYVDIAWVVAHRSEFRKRNMVY